MTVEVGIDRSRFDLGTLRVVEGTLVQFVLENNDPIDHELVVGDGEVHRRHAGGTERRHPPVPGEVSVPPGERAMTFHELAEAGSVVYVCHLPGHVAKACRAPSRSSRTSEAAALLRHRAPPSPEVT